MAEHHLYDDEDLLERAVTLLETRRETAPLFLYDFYKFNPLQRRLITAAVQERDTVVFLPWRVGSAYEYVTPLLTWFTNLGFQYTPLERSQEYESNLTRLQQGLFEDQSLALWPFDLAQHERGPSATASSSLNIPNSSTALKTRLSARNHLQSDSSVLLISSPSKSREAREIGRTVLELIRTQSFHFHEIAILLRDPATYGPLIAETLTGLGIPCFLSGGLPLRQTQAGQSLLLLCQLLTEEYARPRVIEFLALADPPFTQLLGDRAPYARLDRWETFSVEAGIVKGAAAWRKRLSRLNQRLRSTTGECEEAADEEDREVLQAFVEFMQGLLTACEDIPRVNTWQGWVEQTLRLFRTYVSPSAFTSEVEEAMLGLGHLDRLGELATVKEWSKGMAAALSAGGGSYSEVVLGEKERWNEEGVWIGALHTACGVQFRAILVPGMNEGSFPQVFRQDPILLDAERQHLGEILLHQIPQRDHMVEEERLVFTLTVQNATERLVLLYPRFEHATGQPQVPSAYLLRVIEAISGQSAAFADLEQWTVHVPVTPFSAGPPSTAVDTLEFHLASVEQALTTKDPTPLGYLPAIAPFFSRALHAVSQRWGTSTFTPFDGMIADEAVKALVHRHLFPDGPTLSASALETYARCPFRYFLHTILGLTPREEPERILTFQQRERGALLHTILHDFFTRLRNTGQLPLTAQALPSLIALLQKIAEEHFQAFTQATVTGLPLLWELEQERMHERLTLLLKQECMAGGDFLPVIFEAHFGTETGEESEQFFPSSPVRFPLNDGEQIRLRGRIDRIDLSPDQRRARIFDYKTGKPVRGRFAGGMALQLPLYLFAARTLRPDLVWESAEYLYVDYSNRKGTPRFPSDTWAESLATLQEIVTTLVHGIRSGTFVPTPSSCHPCPFPAICGVRDKLHTGDKLNDPRLDSLCRVREIV